MIIKRCLVVLTLAFLVFYFSLNQASANPNGGGTFPPRPKQLPERVPPGYQYYWNLPPNYSGYSNNETNKIQQGLTAEETRKLQKYQFNEGTEKIEKHRNQIEQDSSIFQSSTEAQRRYREELKKYEQKKGN